MGPHSSYRKNDDEKIKLHSKYMAKSQGISIEKNMVKTLDAIQYF